MIDADKTVSRSISSSKLRRTEVSRADMTGSAKGRLVSSNGIIRFKTYNTRQVKYTVIRSMYNTIQLNPRHKASDFISSLCVAGISRHAFGKPTETLSLVKGIAQTRGFFI